MITDKCITKKRLTKIGKFINVHFMKMKVIVLLFFLGVSLFLAKSGFGQETSKLASSSAKLIEVKDEIINPSDDYKYAFKRLKEKILLLIYSFAPDKQADYLQELMSVRLSELKHVVDKEDIGNIETVSQRYSANAGDLVALINSANLKDKNRGTKKIFHEHLKVLESFANKQKFESSGWLLIQHDINYIKEYSKQLTP